MRVNRERADLVEVAGDDEDNTSKVLILREFVEAVVRSMAVNTSAALIQLTYL